MKPIEALKNLNLVCWPALLVGLQRGLATKSDVAEYAINLLSEDLDNGNDNISALAFADSLDDTEIKELLLLVDEDIDPHEVIERWRLATLIALSESALSEEEKLDKLQELYAEFDYPEDMASCSIYSQNAIDPLAAMADVISALKLKFTG